jgi:hypothetical protein
MAAYLVVGFDIEFNLLTGEGAHSVTILATDLSFQKLSVGART